MSNSTLKINQLEDTIAAVSTPIGEGGIGIVRLSGKGSLEIAGKIFKSADGKSPRRFKTYTVHYGHIIDKSRKHNQLVDEVILNLMRAPKSYTREDIVEINCHSGISTLKKILDLTLRCGARLAEPGEFTRRAFINGRIDLAQAEAVLDIVRAKTDLSRRAAVSHLKGELSNKINQLKNNLLDLLMRLEADINFPEERDVKSVSRHKALRLLESTSKAISELLSSAPKGIVLRSGISLVICGRPNVGKSSLFNALLRKERAIVTPLPGTTRDAIEETVGMQGIPVKLIDTAGIWNKSGLIEKESVSRTRSRIQEAAIVVLLFDASQKLNSRDEKMINYLKGKKVIPVINKIDLPQRIKIAAIRQRFPSVDLVRVSALKNIGLSKLELAIGKIIWQGAPDLNGELVITNVRHAAALRGAQESIIQAIAAVKRGLSWEFPVEDIKKCDEYLSQITGTAVSENILEEVFSNFCIGK
jgi:tRNA modification GTPase